MLALIITLMLQISTTPGIKLFPIENFGPGRPVSILVSTEFPEPVSFYINGQFMGTAKEPRRDGYYEYIWNVPKLGWMEKTKEYTIRIESGGFTLQTKVRTVKP